MSVTLDFTALPNDEFFFSRSIMITLSAQIEARLTAFPLTLERIRSAVMFAEQSTKQTEDWRASAFIRAALADFCSIEEVQKTELCEATTFRLAQSPNPLLHLLELMRHLNIHVKSVKAKPHVVPTSFEEHAFNMNVYVISNYDAEDLALLKNGKRYNLDDLKKMVAWFSSAQLFWGAGYVLRVGVESFALELCDHYGV